jgi:hypothetical protein
MSFVPCRTQLISPDHKTAYWANLAPDDCGVPLPTWHACSDGSRINFVSMSIHFAGDFMPGAFVWLEGTDDVEQWWVVNDCSGKPIRFEKQGACHAGGPLPLFISPVVQGSKARVTCSVSLSADPIHDRVTIESAQRATWRCSAKRMPCAVCGEPAVTARIEKGRQDRPGSIVPRPAPHLCDAAPAGRRAARRHRRQPGPRRHADDRAPLCPPRTWVRRRDHPRIHAEARDRRGEQRRPGRPRLGAPADLVMFRRLAILGRSVRADRSCRIGEPVAAGWGPNLASPLINDGTQYGPSRR